MTPEIKIKIEEEEIDRIFAETTSDKYREEEEKQGKKIRFDSLIEELSKLKGGGQLQYSHLRQIEKEFFVFYRYWRWPKEEEITDQLKTTEDLFKDLSREKEKGIIEKLNGIFKNIELTSIILRLVDPWNYAIYSAPVAKILNPPRGAHASDEYINYLNALRDICVTYDISRVDYADMFLWAMQEYPPAFEGLHHNFSEKNIKRIDKEEFIMLLMNTDSFGKAEIYFKVQHYEAAAHFACTAFTDFFVSIAPRHGVTVFDNKGSPKTTGQLIVELCERNNFPLRAERHWLLDQLNELRVDIMKRRRRASQPDAIQMIDAVKDLRARVNILS